MKAKSLIPLVLIAAVLGGLVYMRKAQDKPVSITEQVKLTQLLPEGLAKGDLAKLEVYTGTMTDQLIVLTKEDTGDKWRVTNHFNAPVDSTKIDGYLESLTGLEGEFRATLEGEDKFKDYELSDDTAFHVKGFKKGEDKETFHVLAGKSPNFGTVFMRPAGGKDVFVVNKNLRQDAGIYGEEAATAPKADNWIDKKILALNKGDVTKVELKSPGKELILEYKEKPAETPPPVEPPKEGEPPAPPAPAKAPEFEWIVAKGGMGQAPKDSGITALMNKLANLTATEVVDPSKKAEWKLDTPVFSAKITVKGQEKETIIEGGRPDPAGDGYLRLASGTDDIVYKVNKYNFEQVFPKGSTFFTLPALAENGADITRVELTTADGPVALAKTGEEWAVEQPKADLPAVTSSLATVANALATWKAEDYADAADATGLDAPARKAVFTTKDGKTHTLEFGAVNPATGGTYARLDGGAQVLSATKTDLDKIFIAPKDLYERTVFDVIEDDITSIAVKRDTETESFSLTLEGEKWSIAARGQTSGIEGDKANDIAAAIALMEAENLIFGKGRTPGTVVGTVSFNMKDGAQHKFTIEAEKDGVHTVVKEGTATAFLVSKVEIDRIIPAVDVLLKKPEPAPAPAEAPPAPEAAAPTAQAPVITIPAAPEPATTPAPATVVVTPPAAQPSPATPK